METLELSPLGHTWLLDLDGTVLRHNGYLTEGRDSFLPGMEDFLRSLPPEDTVIFLTSRKPEYAEATEAFLREHGVRFAHILYGLPYGERILVNDRKPSGLETALAVNLDRDAGGGLAVRVKDSRYA